MRTMLLAAVGALSLALAGFAIPPSAEGQQGNTFTVEKVVNGPVPDGAVFEVEVNCTSPDSAAEGTSTTMQFDEDGNPLGSNSVLVVFFTTCTATETVTNGAEVTYACEVSQMISSGGDEGSQVECVDDQTVFFGDIVLATGTITVTNTFEEEPPPPPPPPPDVEPDQDLPDVVDATPPFTG